MMVGKSIGKILILLIIVAMLPGVSALDNMTVLETFPDGQPRHITYTIPLVEKKLINQNWTCPPDQISIPGEPNSGSNVVITRIYGERYWDGQERFVGRCKIEPSPSDYIYVETKEAWLNPYGQITSWKYVERAKYAGLTTVYKLIPETSDGAVNSPDWQTLYTDSEGYVVSYASPPEIPSNRTIKPKIEYPAGYGVDKAMQDLNISKAEAISETNYDRVKAEAFNHSPEYMQKRIQELESQQAQQGTLIDRILNWINSTFGVDLR